MMAWRAVRQTRNTFAGAGVIAGALLVSCPIQVHVVDVHGLTGCVAIGSLLTWAIV
jgi:hypothetical protein